MTIPSPNAKRVLQRHTRSSGLLRTVQPRALATRDALLNTGRRLLNERDFEALSVADLAAANALSVGSFYGRFRDKEAYYTLLQDLVIGEWIDHAKVELAKARPERLSARQLVAWATRHVVRQLREDRGFVHAALKHASTRPESWIPIRRAGGAFSTEIALHLVPLLTHLPAAARAKRVHFATQVLYGTLVNAVLHDPGPLALADPALEAELTRLLCAYLGLDPR